MSTHARFACGIEDAEVAHLGCGGSRMARAQEVQILHLQYLPLQLRTVAAAPPNPSGASPRLERRTKVRIVELATTSFTALAVQALVVATILI
jgi:hypothetical protein